MRLKPWENLLIQRLRLNVSQSVMAKVYNMGRATYAKVESGKKNYPPNVYEDMCRYRCDNLKAHEQCIILRRRLRVGQKDIAKCLKKSVNWISLMEQGEADCANYLKFLQKNTV